MDFPLHNAVVQALRSISHKFYNHQWSPERSSQILRSAMQSRSNEEFKKMSEKLLIHLTSTNSQCSLGINGDIHKYLIEMLQFMPSNPVLFDVKQDIKCAMCYHVLSFTITCNRFNLKATCGQSISNLLQENLHQQKTISCLCSSCACDVGFMSSTILTAPEVLIVLIETDIESGSKNGIKIEPSTNIHLPLSVENIEEYVLQSIILHDTVSCESSGHHGNNFRVTDGNFRESRSPGLTQISSPETCRLSTIAADYVATVKDDDTSTWTVFDDDSVSTKNNIKLSPLYIAMYTKIENGYAENNELGLMEQCEDIPESICVSKQPVDSVKISMQSPESSIGIVKNQLETSYAENNELREQCEDIAESTSISKQPVASVEKSMQSRESNSGIVKNQRKKSGKLSEVDQTCIEYLKTDDYPTFEKAQARFPQLTIQKLYQYQKIVPQLKYALKEEVFKYLNNTERRVRFKEIQLKFPAVVKHKSNFYRWRQEAKKLKTDCCKTTSLSLRPKTTSTSNEKPFQAAKKMKMDGCKTTSLLRPKTTSTSNEKPFQAAKKLKMESCETISLLRPKTTSKSNEKPSIYFLTLPKSQGVINEVCATAYTCLACNELSCPDDVRRVTESNTTITLTINRANNVCNRCLKKVKKN